MVTDAPTIWSSPALEVRMNKGLGARFTGWVRADACVTHDFKTPETPNFRTLPVSACPYVGTYIYIYIFVLGCGIPNVIGAALPCDVIAMLFPCHCHVIAMSLQQYLYIHVASAGDCWLLTMTFIVASSLPDHDCRGVLGFAFTIGGRC